MCRSSSIHLSQGSLEMPRQDPPSSRLDSLGTTRMDSLGLSGNGGPPFGFPHNFSSTAGMQSYKVASPEEVWGGSSSFSSRLS
jgi:hypothetical protein